MSMCVSPCTYYSNLYLMDSGTISKFEIDNKNKEMTSR